MNIRIGLRGKEVSFFVGRTLDREMGRPVSIRAAPRGKQRNGATGDNSLEWIAKYGSVVACGARGMIFEGINECGLVCHVFPAFQTRGHSREDILPGLSFDILGQFYLDCFSGVTTAIDATMGGLFQVGLSRMPSDPDFFQGAVPCIFLADAQRHSAEMVLVPGKPIISTGRQKSLEMGGSISVIMEGQGGSMADMLNFLHRTSVSVSGVHGHEEEHSAPLWRSVSDACNRMYCCASEAFPGIARVHLEDLDLREGGRDMEVRFCGSDAPQGDGFVRFEPVMV